MKILGVDSSLETRKLLKEYIEKMGHKLVLAKQGYEALKIIETEKERFDLFLFEADLQGLSGYEICHKIKDMTNCNNIPVILLMKGDSSENKIRGYQVDADAFLAKPIASKELKAVLNYFLKRKMQIKNCELCVEVAKSISELLNVLIGPKGAGWRRHNYYERLTNLLSLDNSASERLKIVDFLYSKKWLAKFDKENGSKFLSNLKMGAWLGPMLKYLYGYKNKYSKKENLIIEGHNFTMEADILIVMLAFFELKDEGLNNCYAIKILRSESGKMDYNKLVLDTLNEITRTEDLLISLKV